MYRSSSFNSTLNSKFSAQPSLNKSTSLCSFKEINKRNLNWLQAHAHTWLFWKSNWGKLLVLFNSSKNICLYASQKNYDKSSVAKSEKLSCEQFYQHYVNGVLDIISIRFLKTNVMGYYYSRLIQVVTYYCNCPTFLDVAYCHHILAINKFKLANILKKL